MPCGERSSHKISKQGYHHGSVLITCPSCRNRHVISDHLQIFGDRKVTVEDLMREKGRLVKKGTLGEDGDIEFWADVDQPSDTGANAGEEKGSEGKADIS
jgi:mitochondrial protein import protein ZIM17